MLKNRVRLLESELDAEKAIRIRAENLFADESYLNNLLITIIGQISRWTSTIGFCLMLAGATKRLIWTA